MKKILSLIATIAAVTMFTACGDDDASYKATPTLEVAAADVMFEAEGGDGSITLNTSSQVTASTDASWLTLTVSGNIVTVTANPNLSLDGRNAVINLKAGDTETTVTATQKSSIYGVPSLEYEIGDYQASVDIPVVHNQEVTVTSNADWLTAVWNEETNQIEIIAEDNDEEDAREGTVTLTMGDYSDEITITQTGFLLELEKEVLTSKNNKAETLTVSVKHSRPIASVETEDDWITATFNSSRDLISCAITDNETGWRRIGTVTVKSGTVTKTLSISQFDFVSDIQGDYALWYYNSGWKYMFVNLEATSETEGTLTWYSTYNNTTGPFVIPITIDASTQSFSIQNCTTLSSKYNRTTDNTTYDLMAMVMYYNSAGSIYRNASTQFAIIASLYDNEDDGVGFSMDMNDVISHTTYTFYALRIAFSTGGYTGITGNFVTYPYCELERIFPDEEESAKPSLVKKREIVPLI